jgi:hypothetical protein
LGRRLPVGFAGSLVGFLVLASIYTRIYPCRRGIVDGLRFGALIGVALVGLAAVWNYVMQPISPAAGVAMAIECLGPSAIYGAIIGAICRTDATGTD